MGALATVVTDFAETRRIYFRVNNIEVSNHGVNSSAIVRGYVSKDAFESGGMYLKEYGGLQFLADVATPLWTQVYAAFKFRIKSEYAASQGLIVQAVADLEAAQVASDAAVTALTAYTGGIMSERSRLQANVTAIASVVNDKMTQLATLRKQALPAPDYLDVLDSGQRI